MFGSRIKKIREEKRLNAEKFAQILDTSSKTISNYETEKTAPSFIFLEKLTKKLNVNTNWILTGEGEMFLNEISKNTINNNAKNHGVIANNINISSNANNKFHNEKIKSIMNKVDNIEDDELLNYIDIKIAEITTKYKLRI